MNSRSGSPGKRLDYNFFRQDVLEVAPALIGKWLTVKYPCDKVSRLVIKEVEAYRGIEDLACHARRGLTPRTEPMFCAGGILYIYLVYGIHWMLNIVTGKQNDPQAVLVRAAGDLYGPGRLTKSLGINSTYNHEDIVGSTRIWIEGPGEKLKMCTGPRIGVEYAGEYWSTINWRFFTK